MSVVVAVIRWLGWQGLAIIVLSALLTTCTIQRDRLTEEVEQMRAVMAVETAARQADAELIGDLQAANERWASVNGLDRMLAERKVAELQERNQALAAELDLARRERQAIYRTDSVAKAWADTPVPAAVVERLRATK